MKTKINSGEQSPNTTLFGKKKIYNSFYKSIPFSDLCSGFYNRKDDVFSLDPKTSNLNKWIKSYNINYFVNELYREMTSSMLVQGKAFFEIVIESNGKNTFNLYFKEIYKILSIPLFKNQLFLSINDKRRPVIFKIPKEKLVVLNIKDIGLSSYRLRKNMRKLDKTFERIVDDKLINNTYNIDYNLRHETFELAKIKYTKNIYWDCRGGSNYINDNYYLYRVEKFFLLRKKFLDYILNKINISIKYASKYYPIEGKIKYLDDYNVIKDIYKNYCDKTNTLEDSLKKLRLY